MKFWPDQKITKLLGIEHPVIQAPMAGADTPALAIAVSRAGGLGSLGCALLSPEQIYESWRVIRKETQKSINLNFFCNEQKEESAPQQERWKKRLAPYYKEFGIDIDAVASPVARVPFNDAYCSVVEEIKPQVISFHFGLPAKPLLERVRNTGTVIISSATTVEEAVWLERQGCDCIIAQGAEAGGHRGMFLTSDISTQVNTPALVPRIVEAVSVPVIAAGGIADARGIKAAVAQGASAVQLGTAYLFCPEAKVSPLHLAALATDGETALTNIYTGKPARGIMNRLMSEIGPMSSDAPDFPYASKYVMPLRSASEKSGKADFMQMWAGQVRKAHQMPAEAFTKALCREALELL